MGKWNKELDMTDKWLKENDPYFTDKSKDKRDKEEYSYETPRMMQTRSRRLREIPFSNLYDFKLLEVAGKGLDIKMYMDDAN